MSAIETISSLEQLSELSKLYPNVDWRKYGEVCVKEKDNLLIFNYTPKAQYDDRWNFFERVSRGLIIDKITGEIVARPFDKFFNWFEKGKKGSGRIVTVTEKMDGSLGILYRADGTHKIATRGSFDSDQAILGSKLLEEFNLARLPEDLTLLFEVISPENRIVVNYGDKKGLVLLAARNRNSGEYLPFFPRLVMLADFFGFELVKVSSFNNVADILNKAGQLDLSQEGWVIEMSDGSRWKIKGDRYIEMHKLVSGLTFKNALIAFRTNTVDNLLKYVPDEFLSDFKIWIAQIQSTYLEQRKKIQSFYDRALEALGPSTSRKDYALWMKKNCPAEYMQYMFLQFDYAELRLRDLILRNLVEPENKEQPVFFDIQDIVGIEGSNTYDREKTKLCADWRELQAQLAEITADRDSEQRWACEYFAETLKLEAKILALAAQLEASKTDYEDMREAWKEDEKRIAALIERVANVQGQMVAMQTQLEKGWDALANVAEYLERSVTADDWELSPATKCEIRECLEAKRDMDADDRRSLDLFDA